MMKWTDELIDRNGWMFNWRNKLTHETNRQTDNNKVFNVERVETKQFKTAKKENNR